MHLLLIPPDGTKIRLHLDGRLVPPDVVVYDDQYWVHTHTLGAMGRDCRYCYKSTQPLRL